ncbi:MAG: tetratricopeptide repeat protein, partial [Lentilitoribacter sp.]
AYNNMGNALEDQSKLEEAIEAYNKALAIKPDYPEAYNNKGIALEDQGKLEEAIEAYNKALAIKPDNADAYYNMGNTLKDQGKLGEAIEAYNKALAIKPDYAEAYDNMGIALEGAVFKQPNPGLQKIIASLLDKKSFVMPKDIARAALSLLKFEPRLKRHLQSSAVAEVDSNLQAVIKDLSDLPLLSKLMRVCPLPDLELENLFRELRKNLLLSIADLTGSIEELEIQSTLALHCFTNEYIYNQSEQEDKALTALEGAVKQSLNNGDQPSSQSILCLASYSPLNQYDWSSSLRINDEIEDVFVRQIAEPSQELQIKTELPVLEEITDKVSSKVRDQYELSPYPRWVSLGLRLKAAPISKVIEEIKLKLCDDKVKALAAPDILIAGCGTGQHSIRTATRFKGSKVLAIDLSLSSLSYAKRKTEELGIRNIDYLQADILDLGKLGRQFDIVESAGVLHHMDDPVAGWRVLADCLKPNGLMNIGLYSELARQDIVEMRQEISKAGIGSSDAAMKSFRNAVMKSGQNHHKEILSSSDFYSLSTLKDLLFHVQEHRFTIPQIRNCLSELGLKFCGFESDKIVSHFKQTNTDADDPYDLDRWQTYEEANPRAFVGMYQFWCQKIA